MTRLAAHLAALALGALIGYAAGVARCGEDGCCGPGSRMLGSTDLPDQQVHHHPRRNP